MEQIDWSKAPEGAEIHLPNQAGTAECFVMFRDSEAYYAYPGMTQWVRWAGESKETMLSRFRHSPKGWSGAGLPPVGTVCEHHKLGGVISDSASWQQVKIIAHVTDDRRIAPVAVYMPTDPGIPSVGQAIAECFRPIRTTEQIAAEQREKECNRMIDVISASPWGMTASPYECAALLYDYGYRKFEIVPE